MKCSKKGFYVRYGGDTIQLAPPFIAEKAEIDRLVNALARRARRDRLNRRGAYSASIPAALTMRPHFCDSPVWNFASSSGEVVNTSVPVGS